MAECAKCLSADEWQSGCMTYVLGVLQFVAQPFLNDTLDCLSMISVFLYLGCGLAFQQKDLADPGNPHYGTYLLLPKLAQGAAGFTCCFAVLTFYLDFRAGRKVGSVKVALRRCGGCHQNNRRETERLWWADSFAHTHRSCPARLCAPLICERRN